jgi:hypothetical protein
MLLKQGYAVLTPGGRGNGGSGGEAGTYGVLETNDVLR